MPLLQKFRALIFQFLQNKTTYMSPRDTKSSIYSFEHKLINIMSNWHNQQSGNSKHDFD